MCYVPISPSVLTSKRRWLPGTEKTGTGLDLLAGTHGRRWSQLTPSVLAIRLLKRNAARPAAAPAFVAQAACRPAFDPSSGLHPGWSTKVGWSAPFSRHG